MGLSVNRIGTIIAHQTPCGKSAGQLGVKDYHRAVTLVKTEAINTTGGTKSGVGNGAGAVLIIKSEGSSLGKWMSGLETRTARNVVIVATANKLARISWAVLANGNDYQPLHKPAVLSN